MKKKIIIITLCLVSIIAVPSFACDVCGSGVGGGYLGILPGFKNKFVSLRYSQNGLTSHLGANGNTTYLTAKENYRIAELWGAANIGKKFRVAAFIPVNFLEKQNQSGKKSASGLGDITAIGYYQLLNKTSVAGGKPVAQSLWLGGGVKLPTGKYNEEEPSINAGSQNTFQLGTGSVDFSLNAMYDIRFNNTGLNANAAYKINTKNKYDYQYGNKTTLNILLYHNLKAGKSISISPNAGVLYEKAKKDHKQPTVTVWETGGYSLMGTFGAELSFGVIGAGLNFQTPLSQNLGEGKMKANNRGMVYLSYSF